MTMYAIFCGNFGGSSYYHTREEAQNAADFRTNCTGMKWIVREIICPNMLDISFQI